MKYNKMLKPVLCISAMGTLNTTTILMPIMELIQNSFSNTSATLVSLMFTLPSLLMIPALLISGKLCQKFSKKKIIIFGYLLMGFAGVATGFFENIGIMLVMRCFVGISSGLIAPVYSSLYADYYSGHDLMRMNGLGNGTGALIGIVMSLLSGIIASNNWHLSFWLYAFCFFVAILQIIFLPRTKSDLEMAEEQKKTDVGLPQRQHFVRDAVKICFFAYIFISIATPFNFQISGYIIQEEIGGGTITGIISAIITFGMFLSGVLFATIHKRIHRYIFVLMPVLVGICYIGLYSAKSVVPIGIMSMLMGLGNILILPSVSYECARIAPVKYKTIIISMGTAAIFLGQFTGNFVPGLAGRIVSFSNLRTEFYLLGILCLAVAVGICIVNIVSKEELICNSLKKSKITRFAENK